MLALMVIGIVGAGFVSVVSSLDQPILPLIFKAATLNRKHLIENQEKELQAVSVNVGFPVHIMQRLAQVFWSTLGLLRLRKFF